ncbi:MAG: hypothetical protein KGJ70_09225, partial [Gemmatimonadota bacterium]|nr:hypothetical protein [Gemmatimonadota bacterium]
GGLVVAFLCMSNVTACRRHSSSYARVGDDPHDTDSLYVLYRRILTDSDPVPTAQQIYCAYGRLADKLGDGVAERRLHALRDTVYSAIENQKWREVDRKLLNHGYGLTDKSCGPGFEGHYTPDTAAAGVRPPPNPAR